MTITIYAASSAEIAPVYARAADELGRMMARRGFTCINGGGGEGLMARVTEGVLSGGGRVIGVIPRFMVEKGWCHPRLTEQVVAPDMHRRKEWMVERSDACIALPGGVGTLEELLEIIAWKQLGLYRKPVVVLNINGYFDDLLRMLARAEGEGFLHHACGPLWSVATVAEEALERTDL
jgi:uncharacterized protein (TIGR00730 family)